MTGFSSLDDSPDPQALIDYLEMIARAASGMKHYAAATHAVRGSAPVLDVGCGAGHDLALLATAGVASVGLDPSATALRAALARTAAPLVRGAGERLPFRDGSFRGCHVERVLIHVEQPAAVLAEAVRCLAVGGLLTVYEPDWGRFRVRGDDEVVEWLLNARNPAIGGQLWELVESAGCAVSDRVEEFSVWSGLSTLARVIGGVREAAYRAVVRGLVGREEAERWLARQHEREVAGQFVATIPKVLIVATKL